MFEQVITFLVPLPINVMRRFTQRNAITGKVRVRSVTHDCIKLHLRVPCLNDILCTVYNYIYVFNIVYVSYCYKYYYNKLNALLLLS
jgi:hypothetical protein